MEPPAFTRPAKSSVMVGDATVVVVVVVVDEGDVAVLLSSQADTASVASARRPIVTLSGRRVSILDVTSWGHGGLAPPPLQGARP